jgi:hypothetical protein
MTSQCETMTSSLNLERCLGLIPDLGVGGRNEQNWPHLGSGVAIAGKLIGAVRTAL